MTANQHTPHGVTSHGRTGNNTHTTTTRQASTPNPPGPAEPNDTARVFDEELVEVCQHLQHLHQTSTRTTLGRRHSSRTLNGRRPTQPHTDTPRTAPTHEAEWQLADILDLFNRTDRAAGQLRCHQTVSNQALVDAVLHIAGIPRDTNLLHWATETPLQAGVRAHRLRALLVATIRRQCGSTVALLIHHHHTRDHNLIRTLSDPQHTPLILALETRWKRTENSQPAHTTNQNGSLEQEPGTGRSTLQRATELERIIRHIDTYTAHLLVTLLCETNSDTIPLDDLIDCTTAITTLHQRHTPATPRVHPTVATLTP